MKLKLVFERDKSLLEKVLYHTAIVAASTLVLFSHEIGAYLDEKIPLGGK